MDTPRHRQLGTHNNLPLVVLPFALDVLQVEGLHLNPPTLNPPTLSFMLPNPLLLPAAKASQTTQLYSPTASSLNSPVASQLSFPTLAPTLSLSTLPAPPHNTQA